MVTPNTNINIPQSPFIDQLTGRPSREWQVWLQYPRVVGLTTNTPFTPSQGGTGITTFTVGDLLVADGTQSLAKLPDIATGNVLLSGGVGAIPGYGKVGLTTHVSGILPVANGGTNKASWTANGVLYASNATTLTNGTGLQFDGSNLGVGIAPAYRLHVSGGDTASYILGTKTASYLKTTTSGENTQIIWNNATTGDNKFVSFNTETAATERGSIYYNRAGGLTVYSTTSDYRAKTLLGPGKSCVSQLKVYQGVMHGATIERPMMVAHEVQQAAPYAVSGEKDAVYPDGKPKLQSIDYASLVPELVVEIQQLRERIAKLEAKA